MARSTVKLRHHPHGCMQIVAEMIEENRETRVPLLELPKDREATEGGARP